jgi:hypothetical protein
VSAEVNKSLRDLPKYPTVQRLPKGIFRISTTNPASMQCYSTLLQPYAGGELESAMQNLAYVLWWFEYSLFRLYTVPPLADACSAQQHGSDGCEADGEVAGDTAVVAAVDAILASIRQQTSAPSDPRSGTDDQWFGGASGQLPLCTNKSADVFMRMQNAFHGPHPDDSNRTLHFNTSNVDSLRQLAVLTEYLGPCVAVLSQWFCLQSSQ